MINKKPTLETLSKLHSEAKRFLLKIDRAEKSVKSFEWVDNDIKKKEAERHLKVLKHSYSLILKEIKKLSEEVL